MIRSEANEMETAVASVAEAIPQRSAVTGAVRAEGLVKHYTSRSGTIEAVRGTYTTFGQRLTIQRGRLTFDGPLDNPALDVLAVRKNLQVEAGLEVRHRARSAHAIDV